MPRTVPEIAQLVRQGMSTLDTEPFAHLFAADAVYEQPFLGRRTEGREAIVADLTAAGARAHAPGVPRVTKGREELRRRFRAAAEVRRVVGAGNVVIHETADPAVLVAEFDLHQELRGTAFTVSYVMVMTVKDGLIKHTRDYTDTA